MKKQEAKDITFKIAWTVRNFSALKTNTLQYSQGFTDWRICLNKGSEDMTLYLHLAHASSLPPGWSVCAYCTFTVANQYSRKHSVKGDLEYEFLANKLYWGFGSLMALTKLQDPSNGYIVDDICLIEVEFVKVRPQPCLYKKLKKVPENDPNEVDFKDLGRIDKALVPPLEEVCSWHPSFKRSRKFTERAFNSMGQVLQFLKNKKWKDMKNEESREELQRLWEELEMSRLDLSWLEPYVISALNMKEYLKRTNKVKRLKQELMILDRNEQHIGKSG